MKIYNLSEDDVQNLFQVIDNCEGRVELVTGEGDRLNLKSKLSQFFSLTKILSSKVDIPELEIIAYDPKDAMKIAEYMITGK